MNYKFKYQECKAEEPQIKINFVDFSKNIQKNKIKILTIKIKIINIRTKCS